MKTVLILYNSNNGSDISSKLKKGFEDLYSYAEDKGVEFCRAPVGGYDEENNLFKEVQFFKKEWVTKKNIKPDIVYDKTPFYIEKKFQILREKIFQKNFFYNDLETSKVLSNKWLTYERFKDFCPLTFLIESEKDLVKVEKMKSEKIICKPITGSGGEGIVIFPRNEMRPIEYPFIVQEFIETSSEDNDEFSGPHDLRVFMKNKTPFYAYLRIPQEGDLIANLSHGGRMKVINVDNLPKAVFDIVSFISQKFEKNNHKLYSVDLIFDKNQKPWILEMNSRPGITLEKEELEYRSFFYNNLIDFFLEI